MSPQFWDLFPDTGAASTLPSASGWHFREQEPDVAPNSGLLDGQWGLSRGQQPGLGEIPEVRTVLPHSGTQQGCYGKAEDWQAASLGSALATNQASVASKHHSAWERCGEGLWGCAGHSPHPPGDFVLVLWSQRKSVTRRGQEPLLAPTEHLKGSNGTDTRPTDPQPKPGQAVQLFGK